MSAVEAMLLFMEPHHYGMQGQICRLHRMATSMVRLRYNDVSAQSLRVS